MNIDFSYYLAVFWRRFHYFAIATVVMTGAGIAVALVLPSEYRSTATLLVESQQIPRDLAPTTVQTVAREQLQIIEQRLMTRANLLETVSRLNVFANEPDKSAAEIVAEMRERTTFKAEIGRDQATFFRVSFQADDAGLVAQVTNDFVTQILEENVRIRTDLAGGTLEFFEDEVERLGAELNEQSATILKFKSENLDALPENRDFLANRRANLTDTISQSEQRISLLQRQKENAIVLFNSTGATSQNGGISPEQAALNSAQQALDDALIVFAPTHPRIALLRSRLAQAQDRLARVDAAADEAGDEGIPAISGSNAVLDAQIADLDRQISDLEGLISASKEELERIDGWLAEIPANAVLLGSLERDYQNVQQQYQQASDRLSVAATGERIELLSKGQRILVLEQATRPDNPYKPNRKLIAAAGAGAGLSLGLGLIVLLELLNRSIRRPVEITDKLGITPFAVLPYVQTEGEVRWRRTLVTVVALGLLIGVPLLVWLVHVYVVPLDPFAERLLNKAGLSLTL